MAIAWKLKGETIINYIKALLTAELLSPSYLWLLLPVILLLVFRYFQKKDNLFSLLLRLISLSFLTLALAHPIKQNSETKNELTALIDISHSVSKNGLRALLGALKPFTEKGEETNITVIPFGGLPSKKRFTIHTDFHELSQATLLEGEAGSVDVGKTNIENALTSIISRSSSLSSVLLLSDGFETLGDGRKAAALAGSLGVRIYPLVPDQKHFLKDRLLISSLYAPVTAHAGDLVEVRTTIQNSSQAKQDARLEVWLNDKKLISTNVIVEGDEEKLMTVKTPPLEGGLQRFKAYLTPLSFPQEKVVSEEHRWISVKNKSRVLLLSGAADDRRILGRLLPLKGYAIDDIVADGSSKIPSSLSEYSTVLINNVAKRQLPGEFLTLLKTFTESGGGVVIIGGERSFGLGGYIDTPLEEISPVKFVPPQTEKRRLNAAVILVIDKSRSMLENNKIEAAKRAAFTSIETLKDEDFVGVIGFDSAPFVLIRLDKVREVKPIAERRLRNLTAAGSTNLLPALALARKDLAKSQASRKHIIVLSDGKVPPAGDEYLRELGHLKNSDITLSAIALGLDADVPFMKMLSSQGRGAFYQTLDPSNLPEIFVRDIKVSTGEKTLKENQDFPVSPGKDGLQSALNNAVSRFPDLRGFVETVPKEKAILELVTSKQDKLYPVLTSWDYGQGQVIAFSSDANGRWSQPWLEWESFSKFWGDLIESAKIKTGLSGEIDFDLRYNVNRGSIMFDLALYDDALLGASSPHISAKVIEPGGELKNVLFKSSARGRFVGTITNGRPGDYKLEIDYGKTKLPPLAVTIPGDAFGEVPGKGISIQNLSDIAYLSGGMLNPKPKEVSSYQRKIETKESLYLPLLVLSFFLLLFEAFVREVGFRSLFRFFSKRFAFRPANNHDKIKPLKKVA